MSPLELAFGDVVAHGAEGVTVRFPEREGVVMGPFQLLAKRAKGDRDHDPLVEGEPVAVLLDHHGDVGLVLGATFTLDHPAPGGPNYRREFAGGASVEFDRATNAMAVSTPGALTVNAGGHLAFNAPSIDWG